MLTPQRGQGYESLSPTAELPTAVARIIARDASASVRTAAFQRQRLMSRPIMAALATLLAGAAALCVAWAWARPRQSVSSSLRGGAELAEEMLNFCSKIEKDTEFHTEAPLQWKDGVRSAEMCCAQCDGDPECGAWTYGDVSGVEGLSHRCFLKKLGKDEKPQRFNRSGVVSGFPARVLRKHGVVAGMLAKERLQALADEAASSTAAPGAPAPAAPRAASAKCPGDLAVAGHGRLPVVAAKWRAPGRKAEPVDVPQEGWELSPSLASRAYIAGNCTDGEYRQSDYPGLKLLGRTLRYSVDLSGAGCGCNAQLHLAAMGSNVNESACGDFSCGAASGCGASCTDFAVQDANEYAWSSGASAARSGVGNGGGGLLARGRRDWSDSEYGPSGKCVDTAWPFDVAAYFRADGEGRLQAVELTLTQEGERWNRSCSLSARLDEAALGGRGAVGELSEALAAGLTPVISYSGSADLAWLDGVDGEGRGPCVQDSPEACAAAVRFFNFAITDEDEPLHGSESGTDSSLPEMAMDVIHQHVAREAAKTRTAELAGLVANRLVDGAIVPCEKDCKGAGSDVMDIMGDDHVNGGEKSTIAGGQYEESASGNSEWEVVSDMVHIQSRASLDAESLGFRLKGDVFVGKREGGWIRLLREPGFAPVLGEGEGDEREALLKERIVTYEKIVSGTCMDHGLYPIEDPRVCEVAAFTLGYFDLNVSEFKGTLNRPEGCYLYRGELFISSSSANHGHGGGGGRLPICSSDPYPITTATTTTTVTTTTTTTWGFPSLFCFEVMMRHTYEYGLVRKQVQRKASIFTCDEYAVFSQDAPFSLGQGPDGPEVKAIWFKKAPVWKSEDNTAANALLFMHVFKAIKEDGRWLKHHWTVKADPDAVLLPWRLREHLRPATNKYNYLVNCNKMNWKPPFPMIFGSLEAYSNKSLAALFNGGMDRCNSGLTWRAWGEDKYLGHCMQYLGVQPFYDFSILADARCTSNWCGNPTAAAFHDFKNEHAWFECWDMATK